MGGKSKTWRSKCKDGSFVEGIRHSGEHVHYDSSGGSDIPVHWRDSIESVTREVGSVAKKRQLGGSMREVRKESDEGDKDIRKKSDVSEDRVSDLEKLIDSMSDVRGGLNQESIEAMKREIESTVSEQRKQVEVAVDDVHKQEKTLEERIDVLGEGVKDTEADAKDARSLSKSLKTEFVKQHLSRLEQESKTEAADYKEQKKGLEATVKEVGKQVKDQERRAKKSLSFKKV